MMFTVEEINLMCCFDTSSRKRLIAEMKELPIGDLEDEWRNCCSIRFASSRVSATKSFRNSTLRRTA